MIHASHSEIIKRLKRAEGHLKSIVTMLEEERDCLDVAQQLQAEEKAIINAKKALVQNLLKTMINMVMHQGLLGIDDRLFHCL